MPCLKISTASINTIALDINHNKNLIEDCIKQAQLENSDLLLLPELCLSGYGCEDIFLSVGFIDSCWQALIELTKLLVNSSMLVMVGLPWLDDDGKLYNVCAVLAQGKILGLVAKQNLARSGVHYEPRWFHAWPQGTSKKVTVDNYIFDVGELAFEINGICFGFEICEDAWAKPRLGQHLSQIGIDIMLNPSASHFAIDKHQQRYQIIEQGSKDFNCVYVYCNLIGCEAGRTIYDGGNMIAIDGELLLQGKRFYFNDIEIETTNVEIEITRRTFSHEQIIRVISRKIKGFGKDESIKQTTSVSYQTEHTYSVVMLALALGLWDWQRKTYQKGYVISLSGGADSALCACAVYLAHALALSELGAPTYQTELAKLDLSIDISKPDLIKTQVMPQVLTTVYQLSENSGDVTMNAAFQLAKGLGASHHQWQISDEVASYKNKVETALGRPLTWQQDDIALQNIQARVRSPGIWFIANVEQKLLIATSNLSEASVGYCTMDGDTSGVLAPIGGISKSLVLQLNDFLCNDGLSIGNQNFKIEQLQAVIQQQPTAELRPVEQNDEADLMPFEILDKIRYLSQATNLDPQAVFISLQKIKFKIGYTVEQLKLFVKKYYQLYSRNQWKRERLAVSFHIEHDSACPKTYRRFPVLNNMEIIL